MAHPTTRVTKWRFRAGPSKADLDPIAGSISLSRPMGATRPIKGDWALWSPIGSQTCEYLADVALTAASALVLVVEAFAGSDTRLPATDATSESYVSANRTS
jgi:hypothetical protein